MYSFTVYFIKTGHNYLHNRSNYTSFRNKIYNTQFFFFLYYIAIQCIGRDRPIFHFLFLK